MLLPQILSVFLEKGAKNKTEKDTYRWDIDGLKQQKISSCWEWLPCLSAILRQIPPARVPKIYAQEQDDLCPGKVGGTQNLMGSQQGSAKGRVSGFRAGFRVENLKIRVSGRVPGCAPGSGTRIKPGYELCFLKNYVFI